MTRIDTATKITVIGLLAHYSYAVLLFLTSDLTKDLTFSMSALYLVATAVPLLLVCYAALARRGTGSLRELESKQGQEEI